jgi:hypothetical protein
MSDEKIHVWEAAGLGKAPFRLVDVIIFPGPGLAEANVEAYNNACRHVGHQIQVHGLKMAGICDYCGHTLMNNFVIASKDNKKFVVGSECVAKTGDAGLIEKVKLEQRRLKYQREEEARRAETVRLAPYYDAVRKLEDEIRTKEQEVEKEFKGFVGQTNTWLIEVLKNVNGNFASSLAKDLETRSYRSLSDKCQSICADIYVKQIAGRRAKKEARYEASDEYYKKVRESEKVYEEKLFEKDRKLAQLNKDLHDGIRALRIQFGLSVA